MHASLKRRPSSLWGQMHLNQQKPPGNRVDHFQESEGDTVPSGSPTTAVQPRMRKVAWWPEMAEGGVPLMAGPGLVLLCNLRKCYLLTYAQKGSVLLE